MSSTREPLQTLVEYRKKAGQASPSFGRYMLHEKLGEIKIGHAVYVGGWLPLFRVNLHRVVSFPLWLIRNSPVHKK
jgi:hypothetical protein